ncbi:MAG: ATP-binding protein, partial [Candidatus Promineifilaceae bacterium]
MGVKIDEISVKNLGPIEDEQLPLGQFNLIYGHNEKGKTYLVEFVTDTLFRTGQVWSLRSGSGRGQVIVSGLKDQPEPLKMTRSSKPKLEELLQEDEVGLPTKISRLLVVKGADLSFDDTVKDGINEAILKDLLSGEGILDVIQNNISKTNQNSQFTNGNIDGRKQGEIRSRNEYLDTLDSMERLFEEIDTLYSGGELQALEVERAVLDKGVAEQEEAKKYYAYLVSKELVRVDNQLDELPSDKVVELESSIHELDFAEARISRMENDIAELEEKSKHYEWLSQSLEWYESRGKGSDVKPSRALLVGTGLAILLAILFIVLQIPIAAVASILAAAVGAFFYWRQMQKSMELIVDADEMKKLSEEFEKRFNEPLSGLPQMRELKESMDHAYVSAAQRRTDLENEFAERDQLNEKLAVMFQALTGDTPERELWPETVAEIRTQIAGLQEERAELREKKGRLDVAPGDVRDQPAAVEYDQAALAELISKRQATESKIGIEKEKLGSLLQNICSITKDPHNVDWEIAIQHLQERREKTAAQYRQITAEIVAGMLVNNVLDKSRLQEKEKIASRLASPEVADAIHSTTDHYTGARYEDGQVLVEDPYGEFAISELSTGAREQVLLALRMAFAELIFKQRQLFLILDDAFQHADWDRRKFLVEQVVRLAKKGWQIIYFTM